MATRRLKRSTREKILFGVAGGLAEHFDIDPVLVRVGFVLLTLLNGLGLIGYIILAIVTPKSEAPAHDTGETARENIATLPADVASAGRRAGAQLRAGSAAGRNRWLIILGAILVLIGVWLLVDNLGFFKWIVWATFWPLAIIVAGGVVLLLALRRGAR